MPSKSDAHYKSGALPRTLPPIVPQAEWQRAWNAMLAKEKAQMKARDALIAERRRMPWMEVEKSYAFEGPEGRVGLLDLFAGRRQLIVYRAFFEPGVHGWPDHACVGCSMVADQVSNLAHLHARDTRRRKGTSRHPRRSFFQRKRPRREMPLAADDRVKTIGICGQTESESHDRSKRIGRRRRNAKHVPLQARGERRLRHANRSRVRSRSRAVWPALRFTVRVRFFRGGADQRTGTKTALTGTGTSRRGPVGVRRPVFGSMRKTATVPLS